MSINGVRERENRRKTERVRALVRRVDHLEWKSALSPLPAGWVRAQLPRAVAACQMNDLAVEPRAHGMVSGNL